jgi:hypothetical protein
MSQYWPLGTVFPDILMLICAAQALLGRLGQNLRQMLHH